MYARLGIRECREIARHVLSRAACVRRAPTTRMGMRAAATAGAVRVNGTQLVYVLPGLLTLPRHLMSLYTDSQTPEFSLILR